MRKPTAVALGAVSGLLSGLLGIGGGLVVGPALLLGGFPAGRAFGTALWVVAPVAFIAVIAGTISTPGNCDWLVALLIALGGQLGAPFGARALVNMTEGGLRKLFIFFLVYIALRNLGVFGGGDVAGIEAQLEGMWVYVVALALGGLAGVTSSLFGVGGGVVVVPGLLLAIGGFSFPAAAATSLAAMVPTALRGAWLARSQRRLDYEAVKLLAPVAAGAAIVAVWLRDWVVGQEFLNITFASFLLFAALMLWRRAPGKTPTI